MLTIWKICGWKRRGFFLVVVQRNSFATLEKKKESKRERGYATDRSVCRLLLLLTLGLGCFFLFIHAGSYLLSGFRSRPTCTDVYMHHIEIRQKRMKRKKTLNRRKKWFRSLAKSWAGTERYGLSMSNLIYCQPTLICLSIKQSLFDFRNQSVVQD